jgi:two-component system, chemotaxis family, chemotaxis protein CheY
MRLKVLTVDDSRTMRDMLRMTLSGVGMTVFQAEDGLHGLEVLETASPDLIITDINMPRLDGFGFIGEVRKKSNFGSTPILVLTTEADPEKKARARVAGATGWIVKPFEPERLIHSIHRVLA